MRFFPFHIEVIGLTVSALIHGLFSIPVDNGLTGDPELICGPGSIRASFETQNRFEGNIFVKGLFAEDDCRKSYSGDESSPFLKLPFEKCGVRRARSLNPKGVFVSVAIIISFHPQFLTKVDRAYLLSCFYMEAEKTVSTGIDVSMLTPEIQTPLPVPMPRCRYEIRREDAERELVRSALVGDKVYHRWVCDTPTEATFCMNVHSCFVDDTRGKRIMLLTEEGCAVDKFILGNLDYVTDLEAGKPVHVYKFADNNNLYFDCQVQITVKEPGSECERPQCEEPSRGKRSAGKRGCVEEQCLDVQTSLSAVQAKRDRNGNPESITATGQNFSSFLSGEQIPGEHCFTISDMAAGMSGLTLCCMILSTSIIFAMYRWKRRTVVVILRSQEPTRIPIGAPRMGPGPGHGLSRENPAVQPPELKPQIKAKPETPVVKPKNSQDTIITRL